MKLALFSCLIAGITAAANEGALGICAGTDKEFTVGFLNANYPTIPKDLTKGTHWYTHPGLASGICDVKDVEACENVCRSVEGCNYFSMSHTQACYACFIHKTCDAPSTKIGPEYKTYELLATPKAPAGSEFAGNGICHGTDSEFTTAFLNAKYPNVPKALTKGTHWYTHNGLASGICHVRDIAACEKVCDAVEGCNYFSISLTQDCYACFIHKTCDKSRTEIGARYHNYKFLHPTAAPTAIPTPVPTASPTAYPTPAPSASPTAYPSPSPTAFPTPVPTASPTASPTTSAPTPVPTLAPTAPPTHACPATCKIVMVNGLEVIKTTHKQNGTPFTKHKCYIEGDACKCFCE